MSFDIFNIANSGIRANAALLQTTSKNIANVNTEGYVRERTEFTTMVDNQVGRGQTYRLLDQFAQKQVNRDTSSSAYFEQFTSEASRIDTLFSESSNSLSTGLNNFFNNVQESLNQPSSNVARSLVMTDAQNYLNQLERLSTIVSDQSETVNQELEIFSNQANDLISTISQLNTEISSSKGTGSNPDANSLYNERDKAIKDLSELVDIETIEGSNGEKQVYLGSGQALVMENGTFNLFSMRGDPDPKKQELRLDVTDGKAVALDVDTDKLKGKIGGLVAFRNDILEPAQNQLGQMGLALADAFNQQNRLGMNADGELGGDIFSLPSVAGLAYQDNTGNGQINATLEPGQGSNIPASDFVITYTSATTVSIQAIDSRGEKIGEASDADIVGGVVDSSTVTNGEAFGLQLNMSGTGNVGDQFQVKLNSNAATNIQLVSERPENLALASPIRTVDDIGNVGDASISPGVVSNVTTGSFSENPPRLTNGPITLVKTENPNEYTLSDGVNSETFVLAQPGKNVLSQAGGAFADYGFDFNLEGLPQTGDKFTLEFNEGGIDDNRNGLAIADIQNDDLVRQNVVGGTNNHKTLNESYAGLVSEIGVVTNQAKTNGAAFKALAEQSEAWYESLSGVNLDEEAANLLRFQQSYAASAQALSAARDMFDTLLNAAR